MSEHATTEGERRLLAAARSGGRVDLEDLAHAQRVVSPDVIRLLCVGPEAKDVDPRGIWIVGARVLEPLDLSFCTVPHPLRFEATTFEAVPDLSRAQLTTLWLTRCSLPGLAAEWIRLDELRLDSSEVRGAVCLRGASIGGDLNCAGARLSNKGATALSADQAEISGGVFLGAGFSTTGEVRLPVAKIGGQLNCSGATLSNTRGYALFADQAEISGGVFLGPGFGATGEVRLLSANIGELNCAGATLNNEGGYALFADGAEIRGGVFLGPGFSATGEVRLLAATISGPLASQAEATLSNKGGKALSADGAEIRGDVGLGPGFSATGEVRLPAAKIGGSLVSQGETTLSNNGGMALFADRAEISGGVFLDAGFRATGEVRLPGTRIGGQFRCRDATLSNEGGLALSADTAEISGDVLFEGLSATGAVTLLGAKIGGQLYCEGAEFEDSDGYALAARDAVIGHSLVLRNVRFIGGVDLFRASATTLDDDLGNDDLGSWQDVQPLVLDGFSYARFGRNTVWAAKRRREWLKQTSDFQRGAWEQLIDVYRALGEDDEASRAAIAMENDRVKRTNLSWYRKTGRDILRVTVGHGYRPWLAGVWAVAIITLFALMVSHWSGMFIAAKQGVTGSPQPVAYAADTFLPIIDFGQADDWIPTGWLRWVDWSVILLGWALTTIFVAGFTRIVRSE